MLNILVGVAALLSILDYFGIKPHWASRKATILPPDRSWKLIIMLILVAASLGMSGYDFYRFLRPSGTLTTPELRSEPFARARIT